MFLLWYLYKWIAVLLINYHVFVFFLTKQFASSLYLGGADT